MQKFCKVAIVDDHPVFLTVLGELLQHRTDFLVVGMAQSGQEAAELCSRTRPDMVLVDMMMPGMSGLELIKTLRRQNPDVVILAMSGMMSKEIIHMAFVAGVNGYFSKSRSIDELLHTLKVLSEGRTEMTPEEADALRWAVRERRLRSEISTRDLQLLRLYSDDLPVKEIAQRTGRTPSSVYKAFKRIRLRLDVKTDWELRQAANRFCLPSSKETIN